MKKTYVKSFPKRLYLLGVVLILAASLLGQWVVREHGNTLETGLLPAAYADEFKELKKGSSGQAVKEMQYALYDLGYYDGPLDGNFSKALESAVKAFQQDFDLPVTGRIDYDTYLLLVADVPDELPDLTPAPGEEEEIIVIEGEWYQDKEHVAEYLRIFGKLPDNYITKKEAQKLGWVSSWGNLWKVAPGMSIGGDRFGNYEGLLPEKKGRQYFECDIDFEGEYRNAKRIIFSNDGLIFYTEDHYETFEEITER